ncbi:unnamed protein product [Caenorhabditis auriculariae]|uniref:GYF domain-containing protein n=1 Tax=Caenorhabditis auriculariae TaxID=2777116 RepID=A0A8S1H0U4_9PELO|nr:unnamed protein product [Caenorhabditis auriculariae]
MMTKPNGTMNGNNASSGTPETRWFYFGPDNECYGPYTGKDMAMWTQSGYFNDSLPIRTENEERYHTLGEWMRACGGKTPFAIPVYTMEHLMQQLSQMRTTTGPPMMLVPPGLAPPYPPPVRFPQYMPGLPQMMPPLHPNASAHPMHSQPPSEPIDAGSVAHTPDSEQDIHSHQQPMSGMQKHVYVMAEGPSVRHWGTETDLKTTRDVSSQTNPIIIPSKDAARFLSELIGQTVHVT